MNRVVSDALLSPDRAYRYWLTRSWGSLTTGHDLVVIGLNPSTADESTDDHTIRRCMSYARAWGHPGLVMLNLFAFRSTIPEVLLAVTDPIGPENDRFLKGWAEGRRVLCAWGTHGYLLGRNRIIVEMLREVAAELVCFGLTKHGHPKHPARLPNGLSPVPFGGDR